MNVLMTNTIAGLSDKANSPHILLLITVQTMTESVFMHSICSKIIKLKTEPVGPSS